VGVDANAGVLDAGRKNIEASVTKLNQKLASKGGLTAESAAEKTAQTMANLSFASSTDALADVDLIVEAIVENMDVKKKFYEALGKVAGASLQRSARRRLAFKRLTIENATRPEMHLRFKYVVPQDHAHGRGVGPARTLRGAALLQPRPAHVRSRV
jgi:3-hydroxyacyl-CoA dehydrogenase